MQKQRDANWAYEMFKQRPPARYSPTMVEAMALASMADPIEAVAAAYNYGFKRGQNYERNKARYKPLQKRNSSH